MSTNRYISLLNGKMDAVQTGNKAQSILFLKRNKCRVPVTYVVDSLAYEENKRNNQHVMERLEKEIVGLPAFNYAVRSSTSAEDGALHSCAGQFYTAINVSDKDQILSAIVDVWNSASSFSEPGYGGAGSNWEGNIKCAVMLQEMVPARLSGVSFSRNPVTNLNELVIEAVEGFGEELVQKGVTPMRWRLRKLKIIEGPENYAFNKIIREVAQETEKLAKRHGSHVDIEWAWDGKHIYYLQLRSITTPEKLDVFSNKMAKEMLPGQIKPLVWSVNIPLVNGTKINLISEITGPLPVKPDDLARPFYYRAYFNMARLGEIFQQMGIPVESLEEMMLSDGPPKHSFKPTLKTFRHAFRIIRFLKSKFNYETVFLKEYPLLFEQCQLLQQKMKNSFSIADYNQYFSELFVLGQKTAYLNIIVPVLMHIYNKRLKKRLSKLNIDYDQLDFIADFPELADYSPATWLQRIKALIDELPDEARKACANWESVFSKPDIRHIQSELEGFMQRFGHFSDSGNDFSVAKWAETPDLVFNMVMQSTTPKAGSRLLPFEAVDVPPMKKRKLKKLYTKAGNFKLYREKISSLYIYGYGLFRLLYLKLAFILVEKGKLAEVNDIFYLTKDEVDELLVVEDAGRVDELKNIIGARKVEIEESKDLLLPSVIYGNEAPVLERGNLKNMKGVGVSSGSYEGYTRIVKGIDDFEQVKPGDVLVIPFSDVSWTPALVKAGAIVSEAGGMLSHCSIIAREMGIPALVSVENACALDNGLHVTVDGSNGILTIHNNE